MKMFLVGGLPLEHMILLIGNEKPTVQPLYWLSLSNIDKVPKKIVDLLDKGYI